MAVACVAEVAKVIGTAIIPYLDVSDDGCFVTLAG